MAYDYLINTASGLFFICYIPELYANYKNKNANFYNMPEKIILLLASSFALAYSIANDDVSLIANYAPILGLDIVAFLMRLYYVCKNKEGMSVDSPESSTDSIESSTDSTDSPV
jgi:uncharacterized protein with PQ loop repeat